MADQSWDHDGHRHDSSDRFLNLSGNDTRYQSLPTKPKAQHDEQVILTEINSTSTTASGKSVKKRSFLQKRNLIPPRLRTQITRRINRAWLVELLSWVLSLGCFTAVVALLVLYQDHPITDWPLPINLNTLIALLATIGSTCLAVPLSSALGQMKWARFRGRARPLAQFQTIENASRGPVGSFLLVANGRTGVLASFGASLTVLLLAINPFVQQVVSFGQRHDRASSASIVGAVGYSEGGTVVTTVPNTMIAAVYRALFEPLDTSFEMKPSCVTGNCTWPLFQSLAFCSSCIDMTSKLKDQTVYDGAVGTYSLPSGFILRTLATGIDFYFFNMTASATPSAYAKNGSVIVNVQAIMDSGRDPSSSQSRVQAVECIIQACVNTYDTASVSGIVSETTTHWWTNNSLGNSDSGDMPYYYLQPPGSNTQFTMEIYSVDKVNLFLSGVLEGTYGGAYTDPDVASSDQISAIYNNMASSVDGFASTMHNLARSMTISMRTYARDNQTIIGDAWTEVTYIQISWPWLALPFTVLFLVLYFVVHIMISTRRDRIVPWKNSSLALLTHGLDESTRKLLVATAGEDEDMERVSESILVHLDRATGEWRLIGQDMSDTEYRGAMYQGT